MYTFSPVCSRSLKKSKLIKVLVGLSFFMFATPVHVNFSSNQLKVGYEVAKPAEALGLKWLAKKAFTMILFNSAKNKVTEYIDSKPESGAGTVASDSQSFTSYDLSEQELSKLDLSSSDIAKISRKTDAVFHEQYPELGGQPIPESNKVLAQEWKRIRNCVVMVDYVFHKSHPELDGRNIKSGESQLANEWKSIRSDINGCANFN